jgi:hypothetical protein
MSEIKIEQSPGLGKLAAVFSTTHKIDSVKSQAMTPSEFPATGNGYDPLIGTEWTTPWGGNTQPGQTIGIQGGSIPTPIPDDPALKTDGGFFFNARANTGGVYFGGSTGVFGLGVGLSWGGR